jgi:hypothetical protein
LVISRSCDGHGKRADIASKPRYGCLADIEGSRYVSLCLAISEPLDSLLALVGGESRWPSEFHSTSLCTLPALICASEDEPPLERGLAKPLTRLSLLVRGESGGTAKSHATGLCTSPAFTRASIYQLTLKLSDTAENGKHEPAMGRCRIAPWIFERFEADTTLTKIMKDIEQVAGRASQPIEARHHEHIAFCEASEQLGQFGPAVRCLA